MGMSALDPVAYGKLLAAELPKPILSDREVDRMVARLEELDFAKRKLTMTTGSHSEQPPDKMIKCARRSA